MKKIFLTIIQSLLGLLEKVHLPSYKKLYPKFLKFRGVKIPDDFVACDAYIHPSAHFDGKDYSLITIGKNTTISKNVEILTHDYSISKAMVAQGELEKGGFFLKPVTIGENCFIGAKTILLPGSIVGDNVIVGAGSVVSGTLTENSVYAGNPARKITDLTTYYNKHLAKNDFSTYNYVTKEGEVYAK